MGFKNISIKKKFLIILLVFIIIPFCCISIWIYNEITDSWLAKEYENQYSQLSIASKATEMQLKEYERIIGYIYNYPEILKVINADSDSKIPKDYVNITSTLRTILNSSDYIKSVYLLAVNGDVYYQDLAVRASYMKKAAENRDWKEKIDEKKGAVCWIPTFTLEDYWDSTKNRKYFSCGMQLKDIVHTWEYRGEFVLNIDVEMFDDLFEILGVNQDSTLVISDNQGNVIWSNNIEPASILKEPFFSSLQNANQIYSEQKYEGETYIAVKSRSTYNDWNYISMKKKSEVLKTREWVVSVITAQLAVILLFCIAGAAFIQIYIIKPIQKMVVVMNIPEQDLIESKLYIDRRDEVGILYNSFNSMNGRIKNLIQKNNEVNKKEREYHIQALNAQINPHFIYNTLDTINWMARDIKAKDICKIISSLSGILRYSISKKEVMVSLEEELVCVENYITIYQERYEKAFSYEFKVDSAIYPYRTFKMVLQPIIENSLTHGFGQSMEGAHIIVWGIMDGKNALIKISDNGTGMTEERIAYVLSKESDRIGLSNINQRLKLLYGEEYGLKIDSKKSVGTTVILTFPIMN